MKSNEANAETINRQLLLVFGDSWRSHDRSKSKPDIHCGEKGLHMFERGNER